MPVVNGNLRIYQEIVDIEAKLIYHKYFTLTEINKLSYFDFKLYVKLISNYKNELAELQNAQAQS